MKFALLGDDPVVLPLLRVLAEQPDHRLLRAALLGRLEAEILQIVPSVKIVSGWEELLAGELAAILVCGSAEKIGVSARQLASAGRPLVVFPQGGWDTELIYELSLSRDDNGVRLIPICQWLLHPVLQNFRRDADSAGDAAEIVHLKWEWEIETQPGEEFPPERVSDYLLPDVGLLRWLGGEYHQVTAINSSTLTGGIAMATVTLTGENLPDAVWSLRPVNGPSHWQLAITQRSGTTTFQGSAADGNVVQAGSEDAAPFDAGTAILRFMEQSLSSPHARPDWTDLTRDFEVLDAVRRSLARRRTIDLHFETTSERSLFKTQMTAIGCGTLLLTMFAVIVLLFLGSVLDARSSVEIAAHKADTIFYQSEFEPEKPELTAKGKEHWDRVEAEREDPAIPILVEQTGGKKLPGERWNYLVGLLKKEGVANAKQRVEVRSLKGPWFETLMKIARILVFLPLFLFLGMQMLLLITRPAQTYRKSEKNL